MGNYMCGIGGGSFWGALFTIIIWALIIWAIVAIIQHFGRKRYNGNHDRNRMHRYERDEYEKQQRGYQDGYARQDYRGQHQQQAEHTPRHDAAMEILRQRYARGEITREEFEAGKKDLL